MHAALQLGREEDAYKRGDASMGTHCVLLGLGETGKQWRGSGELVTGA